MIKVPVTQKFDSYPKEIHEVLMRIDSSILSDTMKEKVLKILNLMRAEHKRSYSAQVKIVCHYFMQLMAFNQDITLAEQHIRNFQEKCNKYLISNIITYNSQDFTCQLLNRVDDKFYVFKVYLLAKNKLSRCLVTYIWIKIKVYYNEITRFISRVL